MKFAYADPPYPGMARKHYRDEKLCAEVDHRILVGHMCRYFDSWALSTSSVALQDVLALCPKNVRIGAWVKPFASFKPNVNPAYVWEPVIFWNTSRILDRDKPTIRDFVSANITMKKGLAGAKPPRFWQWLFQFANLTPSDEFVDLFPGTNGGQVEWEKYCAEYDPMKHEVLPLFTYKQKEETA